MPPRRNKNGKAASKRAQSPPRTPQTSPSSDQATQRPDTRPFDRDRIQEIINDCITLFDQDIKEYNTKWYDDQVFRPGQPTGYRESAWDPEDLPEGQKIPKGQRLSNAPIVRHLPDGFPINKVAMPVRDWGPNEDALVRERVQESRFYEIMYDAVNWLRRGGLLKSPEKWEPAERDGSTSPGLFPPLWREKSVVDGQPRMKPVEGDQFVTPLGRAEDETPFDLFPKTSFWRSKQYRDLYKDAPLTSQVSLWEGWSPKSKAPPSRQAQDILWTKQDIPSPDFYGINHIVMSSSDEGHDDPEDEDEAADDDDTRAKKRHRRLAKRKARRAATVARKAAEAKERTNTAGKETADEATKKATHQDRASGETEITRPTALATTQDRSHLARGARAARLKPAPQDAVEATQDEVGPAPAVGARVAAADANSAGDAEDADTDESETVVSVNYSSMTVVQLRKLLKDRGLKVGGNKAELVKRLQDADDSNAANLRGKRKRKAMDSATKRPKKIHRQKLNT